LAIEVIRPTLDWALSEGYLSEDAQHWQITEKGKLFLNDLLEAFMADEEE
ncbi:radical SAM family heme chaperone HemW, partial [Vibrio metoecus]